MPVRALRPRYTVAHHPQAVQSESINARKGIKTCSQSSYNQSCSSLVSESINARKGIKTTIEYRAVFFENSSESINARKEGSTSQDWLRIQAKKA